MNFCGVSDRSVAWCRVLSPAIAQKLGKVCNFSSHYVERKEPTLFCGIIPTDIGAGNVRLYVDIDHTLMYVFFVKSLYFNEYKRAIDDINIWHTERV